MFSEGCGISGSKQEIFQQKPHKSIKGQITLLTSIILCFTTRASGHSYDELVQFRIARGVLDRYPPPVNICSLYIKKSPWLIIKIIIKQTVAHLWHLRDGIKANKRSGKLQTVNMTPVRRYKVPPHSFISVINVKCKQQDKLEYLRIYKHWCLISVVGKTMCSTLEII